MVHRVTGTRPQTCPWRAMYHPIMHEVITPHMAWDEGNLAVYLADDDPAVIHDAVAAYRFAVLATRAEQDKRRDAKRKK